jgi:hypothetical protein
MPFKRLAHCKRIAKKDVKKQAMGWTAFTEVILKKVKKQGFLAESAEVIFPSTEVIPTPSLGFRVMFLAFLLRGFSVLAHEFLCGYCLFMPCNYISSCQIPYCMLPA